MSVYSLQTTLTTSSRSCARLNKALLAVILNYLSLPFECNQQPHEEFVHLMCFYFSSRTQTSPLIHSPHHMETNRQPVYRQPFKLLWLRFYKVRENIRRVNLALPTERLNVTKTLRHGEENSFRIVIFSPGHQLRAQPQSKLKFMLTFSICGRLFQRGSAYNHKTWAHCRVYSSVATFRSTLGALVFPGGWDKLDVRIYLTHLLPQLSSWGLKR